MLIGIAVGVAGLAIGFYCWTWCNSQQTGAVLRIQSPDSRFNIAIPTWTESWQAAAETGGKGAAGLSGSIGGVVLEKS